MSGVFLRRAYLLGFSLAVKTSDNCVWANSTFWHTLYLCFSYDFYIKQR